MGTSSWGPYFALGATAVVLAVVIFTFFSVIWTPRGLLTGPQYGSLGTMSLFLTESRLIFYSLLQLLLLVPFALWSWAVVAWDHFIGNWRLYTFFFFITVGSLGANHAGPNLLRAVDDMYNCGIDTVLKDFVSPIANATAETFDVGICWYDATWAIMFSSVTIGTRELVDCGEQINWRDVLDKALEVPVVTARAWDDWVNRLIDNRDDPAVDVDAAISIEAATNATATILPAADCLCEDINFIWDGIQLTLNSSNLKFAIDNATNVATSIVRTTIRSITNEDGRPVHMFLPSADRLNRTLLHTGAWFDDIDKFAFDIFACTFAETVGRIDELDERLQRFFNISNCRDVEAPRLWTAYYSWWGIWGYVAEIFADTIFHIDEVFEDPVLYLAQLDITQPFDQAQVTAQKIDDIFTVNVFNCEKCIAAQAFGGVSSHAFNATALFWKAVAQIGQRYFNLTVGDPDDLIRDLPAVYTIAQNYDYAPINNELRAVCQNANFVFAQVDPHLGASAGNFCAGGVLLFNATWSIILNVTGVFLDADFLLSLPVDQAAFEINVGWLEFAEFFFEGAGNSTQCKKDFTSNVIGSGVLPANFFCCIGVLVDALGEGLTDLLLFAWNLAIDVVEVTECVAQIITCAINPDQCIPGFCRNDQDLNNIVLPALIELREILYNQTAPPPGTPRGGIMPAVTRAADSIGCLVALPFSRVPCPSFLFKDKNLQNDHWMFDSTADMTSEFLNLTNIVGNTLNVTIDLAIIFFEIDIKDITFCQDGKGGNTDSLECNLIRVFGALLSGTIDPAFNAIRAISRFLGCLVGRQVQQVLNFLANTLQEIIDASTSNILQMIFNIFTLIFDLASLNLSNFICDLKALVGEVAAFIEQLGCAIPIVADIINLIFNLISCEIGHLFCSSMCVAEKIPLLKDLVNFVLGDFCDCHNSKWKACNTKVCDGTFTGTACLESDSSRQVRQIKHRQVREAALSYLLGEEVEDVERYTNIHLSDREAMHQFLSGMERASELTPCDVRLRTLAPHFSRALSSGRLNHTSIQTSDQVFDLALLEAAGTDHQEMAEFRDCAARLSATVMINNIGLLGKQPLVADDFFFNFRRPLIALGEITVGLPMLITHEADRISEDPKLNEDTGRQFVGNAPLEYVYNEGGIKDPTARAFLRIVDYFFKEAAANIWHDGKPRVPVSSSHRQRRDVDTTMTTATVLEANSTITITDYGDEGDELDVYNYYWGERRPIRHWYVPSDEETHALGMRTAEEALDYLFRPTFKPAADELRTLQAYQMLVMGAHTRHARHRRHTLLRLYNRIQDRIAWHFLSPEEQLEFAAAEMEQRHVKHLQRLEFAPRDERGIPIHPLEARRRGLSLRDSDDDDDDDTPSGCANFTCGFDCCENCVLVEKIVNFAIDMWCDCIQYARFKTLCPDSSSSSSTTETSSSSNSTSSSSWDEEDDNEVVMDRHGRDSYYYSRSRKRDLPPGSKQFSWNKILSKRRPGEEQMWPPPIIEPPPPRVSLHWTPHDIRLHDRALKNYVEHGYSPPDLVHAHHSSYGYGHENAKRWYHPKRPLQGSKQFHEGVERVRRGASSSAAGEEDSSSSSHHFNAFDASQEPYCCGFNSTPIPGETSISSRNFSITALTLKWGEALINIPYRFFRSVLINTGVLKSTAIGENLAIVAGIDEAVTWIVNTNTEEEAVDEEGNFVGFGLFASYAFYYGCDYRDNLKCRDQGEGLFPDAALWVTGIYVAGTAVITIVFPSFSWIIGYAWVTWPGSMWFVAYGISPACFPTIPACVADDINAQVQTMTGDCINWDTVFPDLVIEGTGQCGVCNHPAQFKDCNEFGFNDAFSQLFFLLQWLAPGFNNYLRTTGAPWLGWVTAIPAFRYKLEVFDFSGDPPPVLLSCFKYSMLIGNWTVLVWFSLAGAFAATLLFYILIYTIVLLSDLLTATILILIWLIDTTSGSNERVSRPYEEEIVKQEQALASANKTGEETPAQQSIDLRNKVSDPSTPIPVNAPTTAAAAISSAISRIRRLQMRQAAPAIGYVNVAEDEDEESEHNPVNPMFTLSYSSDEESDSEVGEGQTQHYPRVKKKKGGDEVHIDTTTLPITSTTSNASRATQLRHRTGRKLPGILTTRVHKQT